MSGSPYRFESPLRNRLALIVPDGVIPSPFRGMGYRHRKNRPAHRDA
jgi:hypothetical protein